MILAPRSTGPEKERKKKATERKRLITDTGGGSKIKRVFAKPQSGEVTLPFVSTKQGIFENIKGLEEQEKKRERKD